MKNILAFLLLLSILFQACTHSTDSNLSSHGQIVGKVEMSATSSIPPKPVTVTLFKWNVNGSIDSLALSQSDSNGRFSFANLDTGAYLLRTNVSDFYKTGYAYYIHLTADSMIANIKTAIDTAGSGCVVGFAP